MVYIKENQESNEELKMMTGQKKTKRHFTKVTLREIKAITYKGKVWVPKIFRKDLVEWYHRSLQHCGEEIM
eukprot:4537989-Ditylum_brightwellii.AAC.2